VEERDKALGFLKRQQCSARNLIFDGNPYALFEGVDKASESSCRAGLYPTRS